MITDQFQVCRPQLDALRDQQRLHLEAAACHLFTEALVEHPLVEGMLIDDLDPLRRLDHDVAAVHLHGEFRRPRVGKDGRVSGARPGGDAVGGHPPRRWGGCRDRPGADRRSVPRQRLTGRDCGNRGRLRRHHARRVERGPQVGLQEATAERGADKAVETIRLAETNLHLRGVHVDIDRRRGQIEPQEDDRLPPREEHATVALLDGVEDGAVAERPATHEEVLETTGRQIVLRPPNQPAHRDVAVAGLEIDEPGGESPPVDRRDPVAPVARLWQIVDQLAVVRQ